MSSGNVYVIDDDDQVRDSLGFVLRTAGFTPKVFDSGKAFIESRPQLESGCVLLDIRMPGIDGMTLLDQLMEEGLCWPVIMMTGHGDIPMAVKAIKRGADDFLEKPFSDVKLIGVLNKAFGNLVERSAADGRRKEAAAKLDSLTNREREVLQGLVNGQNNKLLARSLDIGVRTVETYRAGMMTKLGASSVSEALQIAHLAGMKSMISGGKSDGM